MEDLINRKFELERELLEVNRKILYIRIKDFEKIIRKNNLEKNKRNEDIDLALNYIFLASVLGVHNHRGKGSSTLIAYAMELLDLKEDIYEMHTLYMEWVELFDFEQFEKEYEIGLIAKRGEPIVENMINRP